RHDIYIGERGWMDIARADGREIDQFDNDDAIYLLGLTSAGEVVGGSRLVPSLKPHLMSEVFPNLAPDGVPRGKEIYEWTRIFIAPALRTPSRPALAAGLAGMIAVAEAEGMDSAAKRTRLEDLFAMQALERLQNILGEEFGMARTEYGKFLERLDDKAFRDALDVKGADGLKSNEYAEITAVARQFKEALISILVEKYGVNSLLVRALLL
ncbi:MAG: acyl-homoserine-lactone synthase, partial [Sphingomonadaceae bacterium]